MRRMRAGMSGSRPLWRDRRTSTRQVTSDGGVRRGCAAQVGERDDDLRFIYRSENERREAAVGGKIDVMDDRCNRSQGRRIESGTRMCGLTQQRRVAAAGIRLRRKSHVGSCNAAHVARMRDAVPKSERLRGDQREDHPREQESARGECAYTALSQGQQPTGHF